MKKLIKWIAIAFAALIVSCAALALIGGPATRDQKPTAQPAVVAPTSVPAPTAVPQAAPTAVPAPASEAQDVAEYGRTMVEHTNTISQALYRLGELNQSPRFSDKSWRVDVAMQLATLRNENTALQLITPPASMRDVHTEVLAATSDFDAMTYKYARGLDALDMGEIKAAIELMKSGTAHINRATELMKAK